VDAEEKKLSHNSETGLYQDSRTGFRLHYFPDIPVDEPDNARICAPLEDKFQRVRYDGDELNCSDLGSGFVKNETRPNGNSSSEDRFDVQAYQKGVNDGFEKGLKEGEKHGFEQAAKKLEPLLGSNRNKTQSHEQGERNT